MKVESSYQGREILGRFCQLIAPILGLNRMKNIRVTKSVNGFKFDGVWVELE